MAADSPLTGLDAPLKNHCLAALSKSSYLSCIKECALKKKDLALKIMMLLSMVTVWLPFPDLPICPVLKECALKKNGLALIIEKYLKI